MGGTPHPVARRSHRRVWPLVLTVTVLLGLAVAGWLGVRGLQARSALSSAAAQVQQLQDAALDGDQSAARSTLTSLQADTQRARDLTSDPVWRLAGHLPWLGPNLAAVSTVAIGVDDLADVALPAVLTATDHISLRGLTPVDGRIDLAPIAASAPAVARASAAVAAVDADLAAIATDDLLGVLATPVAAAQEKVSELAAVLGTAERATHLLPPMLGADGPRRYLLLLQTNSELRATGGLPGSISVITAVDGRIELVEQVAASEMARYEEPVLDLQVEDEALYSARLGRYLGDVNLTPDFATAAALAEQMWLRRTGVAVDGVLATDPVALSYLLGATGPVGDGRGGTLTGAAADDMLLSGVYATVPEEEQNDYFAAVAANVFTALLDGSADPAAAVPALAHAAAEHRLLVWSAHPEELAELEGTAVAGVMPSDPGAAPAIGVFYNDGTASKMDYHLDTSIEVYDSACGPDRATYRVRIVLANDAPPDAAASLPDAVTGGGASGVPAGSIRTNVVVIGPAAGSVGTVLRDGRVTGVGSYEQDGRPATSITVELAPGQEAVLDVELGGPASAGELAVWSTPTHDQPGLSQLARDCSSA